MTISVVIPVYNSASSLTRCLAAVCASRYPDYECIVVDDGSTDGSGTIARSYPVRVVEGARGPRGAAAARNRGAEAARGDILLFVDADVVLHPDTMAKVAATFSERPDVDAVFGSYDDRPADPGFLSQYKNLTHHFVHQHAREDAATFWSGCGAIRKDAFAVVGGFDEVRYSHSSIEDIELGYRLNAGGRKVRLNKQMQVQHLKRWTLKGMVTSDIWERALPWTRAILEHRTLPNDLNLRMSHRLCALLTCFLLVYLAAIPVVRPATVWPVARLGLLAWIFVLTVGNWSGGAPHVRPDWRPAAIVCALVGAMAGLSLYAGDWPIVVLMAPALFAVSADRWQPRPGRPPERILFGLAIVSFLAAAGGLLLSLSLPIWLPVLGVVLLIVSINYPLFVFFARKRGILFALASVPFFLSHYLYAAAAFLAGLVLYVLERLRDGRRSPSSRPPEADGSHPTASPISRDGPPIRTDG